MTWHRVSRASAVALAGVVLAVVSMATMSWYSITGPNIVTSPGYYVGPANAELLMVDPNAGQHHGWVTWLLVALCATFVIGAAVMSGQRSSASRIVAFALACVLAIEALMLVALPQLVLSDLEAEAHVDLHLGFWLTLIGLVLIAVGSFPSLFERNSSLSSGAG